MCTRSYERRAFSHLVTLYKILLVITLETSLSHDSQLIELKYDFDLKDKRLSLSKFLVATLQCERNLQSLSYIADILGEQNILKNLHSQLADLAIVTKPTLVL